MPASVDVGLSQTSASVMFENYYQAYFKQAPVWCLRNYYQAYSQTLALLGKQLTRGI